MTKRRGGWLLGLLLVSANAVAEEPLPEGAQLPAVVDDFSGEKSSFAAAVDRALQRNPQLVIASEEVVRAKAVLEQVRAASIPTLSANGTYTRLDADRVLNGNVILGENQIAANLTLTAPLIAGKSWAAWAHAGDSVKVAALGLDEARRQLAVLAGRAYLTVLVQKRLLDVARTARDAARAQYQFSKARFGGGIGTRLDEVRAAQELATDESQLATAQTSLRRAREALGVIVAAEGPIDAVEDPALPERASVSDALTDADRRPDVRAAILRSQAAHRVTRDSFTDYLPLLNGTFTPFFQDPPSLTVPRTGWQAQLILSLPLFDGGLRYGQRRERSALEREAKAQLEATLRQARSEVRVAFEAVREADRSLGSAREAARLAKEALDLATMPTAPAPPPTSSSSTPSAARARPALRRRWPRTPRARRASSCSPRAVASRTLVSAAAMLAT
jgi:outer membrane protein TolC